MIDLHIHDNHFVGLICGPPRAVRSIGVVDGGSVVHLTTQYLYGEGGPAVSAISGALSQAGRPFAHGFEIYLERATLSFWSFPRTARKTRRSVFPTEGCRSTP